MFQKRHDILSIIVWPGVDTGGFPGCGSPVPRLRSCHARGGGGGVAGEAGGRSGP
ncbi:hypothetical protein LWE61_13535 [Sphingobium sufflavum]|uniref:hypothetical protein n=1 Tax=Sphingobium sufflavum TaxID=1129547 RepID=UPI001F1DC464|nr:hypothetical protein [Sphingobium sufflavum]MCE7797568.1 hypothetical protein [Sphingobium sufflavum]